MEHFLSKLDYIFYDYKRLSPSNIVIMTNKRKIYEKRYEVENNSFVIKDDITHLVTKLNFDYDHEDNDFSSIKYLFANNYFGNDKYNSTHGLTKFINLETLVLRIYNIDEKIMLKLPNIKTLIFITQAGLLKLYLKLELGFATLPITLEKIIFKNKGNKENIEYVKLLKNKLCAYNFPYGCQIFFISDSDEIFTII